MKAISFTGQMVKAILEGRKTQTRRAMKPQPTKVTAGVPRVSAWCWKDCEWIKGGLGFPQSGIDDHARYKAGDILWVRESFCSNYFDDGSAAYKADYIKAKVGDVVPEPKWKAARYMPKEAARLFLRVTGVRVEQVQDILCGDMKAEGCIPLSVTGGQWQQWQREYWRPLWDDINAKRGFGWDTNPWVWVYTFERISEEETRAILEAPAHPRTERGMAVAKGG